MKLGEKLLMARKEAGLSQKALCGEKITRNMLSQIEHGTAMPSMATLRYLAAQLGKPISFFLEEEGAVSPNLEIMRLARGAFRSGAPAACLENLKDYCQPDEIFDEEEMILKALSVLALAKEAIQARRFPYARELLEQELSCGYFSKEINRQRLILLSKIPGQNLKEIGSGLSSMDEELILRTRIAIQEGKTERAVQLLEAAENTADSQWNILYGECCMTQGEFSRAIPYLQKAEPAYPIRAASALERCCRELQDFRGAYEYACKIRAL